MRFENRVFTEIEIAKARRRPFTIAGTYAKRFAAKEAFSKAVGTGFKRGVFMKDIGVVNAPSGAPTLALTGGAALRLEEMTPKGHEARIHLTLTDDHSERRMELVGSRHGCAEPLATVFAIGRVVVCPHVEACVECLLQSRLVVLLRERRLRIEEHVRPLDQGLDHLVGTTTNL